jgi:hypothetical protein
MQERGFVMADRERADVEAPAIEFAKRRGWWHTKINSPTQDGLPDDLFVRHGEYLWIEFKAVGREPSKKQDYRHGILRKHGMDVRWSSDIEEIRTWLR